jgi:tRNA U34 5-methylaminomethyl-2-thiouridine-forming methyltransferase MnmC
MEEEKLHHKIIRTEDGSSTIYVASLNEHYHSIHGAIQESMHVFIENGLNYLGAISPLNILEIGFGTGLNVLLTLKEAKRTQQTINFTSIEKYPINSGEIEKLNYSSLLGPEVFNAFEKIHSTSWNVWEEVESQFNLRKIEVDLKIFTPEPSYNLIYFDAFGPEVQPNLWTEENFKKLFDCLMPGGILVTYSVKGIVNQNMRAAGFIVKRLPGPPGKRHMLRALKE